MLFSRNHELQNNETYTKSRGSTARAPHSCRGQPRGKSHSDKPRERSSAKEIVDDAEDAGIAALEVVGNFRGAVLRAIINNNHIQQIEIWFLNPDQTAETFRQVLLHVVGGNDYGKKFHSSNYIKLPIKQTSPYNEATSLSCLPLQHCHRSTCNQMEYHLSAAMNPARQWI